MANGITKKIKQSVASLIDSSTHLDVARATEKIAKTFGLSDRLVNYTHIELRNKLNEYQFKSVPFKDRILFLPHCLKSSNGCSAKYTDEGLMCKECGKCQLNDLVKLGKKMKYKGIYITPGGSMVMKLIEKHKPKAVVGVCCYDEANMGFDKLKSKRIAVQAVMLLRDGCKDTAVNVDEVKEKVLLSEDGVKVGK